MAQCTCIKIVPCAKRANTIGNKHLPILLIMFRERIGPKDDVCKPEIEKRSEKIDRLNSISVFITFLYGKHAL